MSLNKTNKSNYDLSNATTMLGNAEDVTKQAQQYQVQAPKFTREYGSMSTYINPENKRTVPAEVVEAKKKSAVSTTKQETKKPTGFFVGKNKLEKVGNPVTIIVDRNSAFGKEKVALLQEAQTQALREAGKDNAESAKRLSKLTNAMNFPVNVQIYKDKAGNEYARVEKNWYRMNRVGFTDAKETKYLDAYGKEEPKDWQKIVGGLALAIAPIPVKAAVGEGAIVNEFLYSLKNPGLAKYNLDPVAVTTPSGTDEPPVGEETNLMPEQKTEEKVYELPDQYKALRMAMASQKAEPINIGKLRGKQGILEKITEGALQGGGQAIADKLRGIQGEIEFDKQIAPQLERTYGARFRQSGAPDDYLKTLKESGTTTYASPDSLSPEEERKIEAEMRQAIREANFRSMVEEQKFEFQKKLIGERAKMYGGKASPSALLSIFTNALKAEGALKTQ